MIVVKNIKKNFVKVIKEPGVKGSIKSLFNPKKEIVQAVNKVSFNMKEGEIIGLMGPNGAGKSTLIKILTGILTPTDGYCNINGYIPQKDRQNYVKEIGVVFGQRTQLWWDLPLEESYSVLKEIYEVSDADFKERMQYLNDVLGLEGFIKSPVRTLSLGQRMRADIAAALLHNPKVLFLDEPTIGLDATVKKKIRQAIKEINVKYKTTIILTTHDLTDIEVLCKRVLIIDKGIKIFDGSIEALKASFGRTYELNFEVVENESINKLNYANKFKTTKKQFKVLQKDNFVTVAFDSEEFSIHDVIQYTLECVKVQNITIKDTDIEEIIRLIYEGATINV